MNEYRKKVRGLSAAYNGNRNESGYEEEERYVAKSEEELKALMKCKA